MPFVSILSFYRLFLNLYLFFLCNAEVFQLDIIPYAHFCCLSLCDILQTVNTKYLFSWFIVSFFDWLVDFILALSFQVLYLSFNLDLIL